MIFRFSLKTTTSGIRDHRNHYRLWFPAVTIQTPLHFSRKNFSGVAGPDAGNGELNARFDGPGAPD